VALSEFSNDMAPWLMSDQSSVALSEFSNDMAPWLMPDQSSVSLSSFSNDMAPWLRQEQSNVFLSSFSNDIINSFIGEVKSNISDDTEYMRSCISNAFSNFPIKDLGIDESKLRVSNMNLSNCWFRFYQSNITLSSFSNDLVVDWTNVSNSSEMILSMFSNDIAPWLDREQSNILLSSFSNDLNILEIPLWVDDFQSNVYLSCFSNNIAPWLRMDQSNVLLSSFSNDLDTVNLPTWVSHYQSNVLLSSFSNDLDTVNLPTWVSHYQSNVFLSSFSNDLDTVNLPTWVSHYQSNVFLSSFSNDLDAVNLPTWVSHYQSNVLLSSFSNDLDAVNLPTWVSHYQSNVLLSSFSNDLDAVNLPTWVSHYQSNVLLSSFSNDLDTFNLPTWVSPYQSNVSLSSFLNDLDAFNLPTWVSPYQSNVSLSSFLNDLDAINLPMWVKHCQSEVNLSDFNNDVFTVDYLANTLAQISSTILLSSFSNDLNFEEGLMHMSNLYLSDQVNINSDENLVTIMSNLRIHGKIFGSLYPTNTDAFIELNENIEIGHELVVDTHSSQVTVSNNLTVGGSSILNSLTVINSTHLLGEVFGSDTDGIVFMDDVQFNKPMNSRVEANMHHGICIHDTDINTGSCWKIYGTTTITEKELIFKSHNNIVASFTDSFHPGVINFTGQHRCTGRFNKKEMEDLVGKIVVSTGEYSDLNNDKTLTINEAIPIVSLCKCENDKRCFGVVSDRESDDIQREFKIGNLKFHMQKKRRSKKYMINSVGEGGIWVCNIGGNIYNGDYITSSSLPGFGMKQTSPFHLNYTVAKITCDCDFDDMPYTIQKRELIYKNKLVKCAFVGCVYKF
jgi:hypothetical protein